MTISTAIHPDALARKQQPSRLVTRPMPQSVVHTSPESVVHTPPQKTEKQPLTVRQQCVARREPFPFG